MTTLEILRTGPLALVQDLGRAGLAHLGVTRSGAADRRSHTLANRLVANPDDRATIEVTFGGFSARVRGGDVDIAVTGADPHPRVGEMMFGTNSIHHVRDGQVISLGVPQSGLRSYLAVRGGIGVTPVLGSRSYDVMSAIGPSPLQPGDVLPVGEHTEDYPELDQAPVAPISAQLVDLMVVPGPRDDWLTDPDALVHTIWMASDRSDRVGMRLRGPPAGAPQPRPSTAQRRRYPRRDPGAAQRVTGDPRSRPPGHRRLSGGRRDRRRGHRQGRPGAAGPACAAALGAPEGRAGFCVACGGGGLAQLVNQQCAHPGTHRPPGPHRRPGERRSAARL